MWQKLSQTRACLQMELSLTRLCVVAAWCGLALGAPSAPPQIDAASTYPKRSSDDSALLEWGSSAIIHNADGVVAAPSS